MNERKQGIWVLTQEYNDYNQHGSYFVAAWLKKPTLDQLAKATEMHNEFGDLDRLLSGGGRKDLEYSWYCLDEVEEGAQV